VKLENKKLAKDFIWNTLGTGLNSFNSLFFLIIVTRVNGINDAGIFSIAYSTALILYTIGLYSGRLCQVTDTENKIKDKDYILNRAITCMFMIVLGIVFLIVKQYPSYKTMIFILLCIFKATESFAEIIYGIMQKQDLLFRVGQSLTIKSLVGIIVFLVIDLLTHNLILSCLSMIIINIVTIIIFDFILISKKLIDNTTKVNFSNVLAIFKSEFFVFANSFLGIYVLNAPKYAIDSYLTEELQAIYGYIVMPGTVMVLFAQFIVLPFLNKLKELYANKDLAGFKAIIRKVKLCIVAFGIFAVLSAYFLGPEVLGLIYGENLKDYRLDLALIIGAYIFYSISYVNLVVLTTMRKTFSQFIVYIITALIAMIGSNIFVQNYGINGGAMSCATTLILQFIMYTILTKITIKKMEKKG
jgi:O-antigen/teichoic acid export membrane protein